MNKNFVNQLWITLKYSLGLLFHPIQTTELIIRERNQKASYFAVWITLITMIANSALMLQSMNYNLTKIGIPRSQLNMIQFLAIFILVPISFFLGRFLFIASTKGGLRILAHKTYPKENHERIYLSDTLRLVYPYTYMPTAFEMILLLLNYPGSEMFRSLLSTFVLIYTLIIQIVAVKRIYKCSGFAAFFSPMIVILIIFGIFLLVWLLTTGAVSIFSRLT